MAYESLLTIVSDAKSQAAQLDAAVELARREDAHLDVLCLGVDQTQTGYYYAGATAMVQQMSFARAEEEAKATEAAVRARLDAEDIRWGVEAAVSQLGAMSGLVALRARFSDLLIQAHPYGAGKSHTDEAMVEAALFEGRAPVLVVPQGGLGAGFARRVVLAWDQSNEALKAMRTAMPLLKAADLVNIAIIAPQSHGPERSDPGGALSQLLARHGVKTDVSVLAKTMPRVSDVLCRHIRDFNADLVVMGAYGHSRIREAILGGTTRNMLEDAEVPVFMAH